MRQLLFISLLFFATPVYAGTPMDSTAVNVGIGKIFDSSGRIKRLISVPGQEATIRNDIGAAESGTNTSITSLASHESGTTTMIGNIKLNGKYISNDGNNEGIAITDDGNVGVGTSTPATKLHVVGNATVNGNVGIGTAVASFPLHVVGDTRFAGNASMVGSYGFYLQDGAFLYLDGSAGAKIFGTENGVNTTISITPRGSGNTLITAGNVGLRTSSFGTATGALAIANGTITGVAAIAGQGMIACESGELKAMDASGNITPFSPHSELDNLVTNLADPLPHTYVSTNSYLGKKKIVNMALLIEEIEKLSGKTIVTYENVSKRDWTKDQDDFRVQRDLERLKKESEIDEVNVQIADIDNELIISTVSEERKKTLENQKRDCRNQKASLNNSMPPEYIPQHPPKWMQDRGVILNL